MGQGLGLGLGLFQIGLRQTPRLFGEVIVDEYMAGPELHGLNAKIKSLTVGSAEDRDIRFKGLDEMLHVGEQTRVADETHDHHLGGFQRMTQIIEGTNRQ